MRSQYKLVSVQPSVLARKKLIVTVSYFVDGVRREKHMSIGQRGADDYTTHKDDERKQRYIARHQANEQWDSSGILTKGFWARWLLWNMPTLKESIADVKKRFKL